jgi:hypothetical protein
MHQSTKHKTITKPEQQLLNSTLSEALSQSSSLSDVEISAEFTSVQEKLRSIPKKSYR